VTPSIGLAASEACSLQPTIWVAPGASRTSPAQGVKWKTRSGEKSMPGLPYALHHMLPNLHFHCTTAYDILRHNGVELVKRDFIGNP